MQNHIVRKANKEESKIDCCGDRYPCNVAYICSCGKMLCETEMKSHIFYLHTEGQLNLPLVES